MAQGLRDDALAGEGGVPVQQDRQHRVVGTPVQDVLLGPGDALEHRIDGLQMWEGLAATEVLIFAPLRAMNSPSDPR